MATAALAARARHCRAVGPGQAPPAPKISIGRSTPAKAFKNGCEPSGDLGQRLGAGAEIVIGIGEIHLRADQPDRDLGLSMPRALEDAGIEHRRLVARIGADQQDGVGMVDAGDGGIEQIGGAAERGIEFGAVLAAIDIGRAELVGEQLEREHLLAGSEIAGNRRKPRAVEALQAFGDGGKGLVPGRGRELAVPAHVRPVEPLGAQAVPHMPSLVGDPLLVDGVVDARQDAHDFAAARIDPDGAAERIHDVDRQASWSAPRGAP